MENDTKTQRSIHKGDLVSPVNFQLASKYYLVVSEPNKSGFMFVHAATKKGATDKRAANYSFSALASNFGIVKTSAELRRENQSVNTGKFNDISFDATDHDFWTQICRSCNEKHRLGAKDGGVLQGLICGVRDCEREADFYLDLDIETCGNCREDFERTDLTPTGDERGFLCGICRSEENPPASTDQAPIYKNQ